MDRCDLARARAIVTIERSRAPTPVVREMLREPPVFAATAVFSTLQRASYSPALYCSVLLHDRDGARAYSVIVGISVVIVPLRSTWIVNEQMGAAIISARSRCAQR